MSGSSGSGRPIGLLPILAHIRKGLEPGRHMFHIEWTVPDQTPHGMALWLDASWTGMLPQVATRQPLVQGSVTGPVTELYISR